ncbi:SDR family oxidoreductase [Viridibacillus sp. FSL R5-0477]|uniref:Short-chain dehydrogenase/reductase SDR n=1 Tax=Viridibacillus arenosi FSL R5-213 TaxID=1227360 RepID=W4F1S3_9BACL|nr:MULTISPECIES: SDR family oxidoreductase [Viridibacillus]ETT86272.1 short-chain dehydrogenase/reductase SDR [Viridibacillus arenosi FSL R5-213]OMC84827.1 oxidoreductase [Viridibacillus sp. FSL H8-0123]OMC85829.1 oxidoreductase [Viridibacillus sp. FSL H7-0596]OMC91875.1 oxidoreductase [Viridibacillus arenosi]
MGFGRYSDSLQNKRVVVTGGASGIGLATSLRFAAEGSIVAIFDNNEEQLKKTLEEHSAIKYGILVDVSNPDEVKEAFKEVDEAMDGIDILISNAGISIRNKFIDITPEQWKKVIGINLDGIFYTAQEAAKRMLIQGSGVILMTASTNGITGHPYYADYNASKAGVNLLAKTMALELAPTIRVNTVCPGYVLTAMQIAEYSPEMLAQVNENIPLKRHATPEEIAGVYAFLASDEGVYITGQNIPVDGGELA